MSGASPQRGGLSSDYPSRLRHSFTYLSVRPPLACIVNLASWPRPRSPSVSPSAPVSATVVQKWREGRGLPILGTLRRVPVWLRASRAHEELSWI